MHVNGRHEKPKGIKCRFCDFASGFESTVLKHEEARHIKAGKLDHLCDKCDYRTHLKRHLIRHMMVFHDRDNLKYQCKYCEFKTMNFCHFRRHIKTMHIEKSKIKIDGAQEYLNEWEQKFRQQDWTRARSKKKKKPATTSTTAETRSMSTTSSTTTETTAMPATATNGAATETSTEANAIP